MAGAIEVVDLEKAYGGTTAVAGVSLSVAHGEVFGYLGRNGSGKTTTVRMLTTLARPTAGSARVAGFDVVAEPAEVRARIGVTMQDAALDAQMTATEHLELIAGLLGFDRGAAAARSREVLDLFGLADTAARPIGELSGGMQRRLDIATSLLHEPDVLFLDEPTTGLDPQSRRAMWEEIARLKARGVTVFLTTQYLEEADVLADRLAIIDRGVVVARGTPASLRAEHGRKRITFDAVRSRPDAVARLAAVPGFEVVSSNGRVHVESPSAVADAEILHVLSSLSDDVDGLAGLEITGTSLEDVFLRLTGSSIAEPVAT